MMFYCFIFNDKKQLQDTVLCQTCQETNMDIMYTLHLFKLIVLENPRLHFLES